MSPKLILIFLLSLSFVTPLSPALAEDAAGEDEAPAPEAESPDDETAEEEAVAEEETMDDEEDLELDDEVEEPLEEGMDDERIYNQYKAELRGEDPIEESDAWGSYLDAYPKSLYRLEIESRIEALDEASFDQLELPSSRQENKSKGEESKDASRAEMDLREPALLGMNANTRRKLDVGILWGFQDYFNYEIAFEWAFRRQFSAFGAIRHSGRGFGTGVQAGAKYALIKDTRTGVLLSGAFSINLGYSAMDGLNFMVQPWIGFGWIASDLIQLQTSLSMDLRVDQLHTAVLWDLMLLISPTDRFSVYLQSKQKHSLIRPEGQPVRYLGFHQAGVGVKIRPTSIIEITLGANIPYGWKHWKDYRYIGAHAGLTFYFKKAPLN
jgi:hypothetical protein